MTAQSSYIYWCGPMSRRCFELGDSLGPMKNGRRSRSLRPDAGSGRRIKSAGDRQEYSQAERKAYAERCADYSGSEALFTRLRSGNCCEVDGGEPNARAEGPDYHAG